jgi:hypothetical protein
LLSHSRAIFCAAQLTSLSDHGRRALLPAETPACGFCRFHHRMHGHGRRCVDVGAPHHAAGHSTPMPRHSNHVGSCCERSTAAASACRRRTACGRAHAEASAGAGKGRQPSAGASKGRQPAAGQGRGALRVCSRLTATNAARSSRSSSRCDRPEPTPVPLSTHIVRGLPHALTRATSLPLYFHRGGWALGRSPERIGWIGYHGPTG